MPFTTEWKVSPFGSCRKCSGLHVEYRSWDSFDEAYTDYQYKCKNCGYIWWIDGPDY